MFAKHSEFILVVTDEYCRNRGFSDYFNLAMNSTLPMAQFYETMGSDLFIAQRNRMDNRENAEGYMGDRNFRQLLPYPVICRKDDNGELLFLTYQRGKGVGESRLAGNASIGFGGHLELEDVITFSTAKSVIDIMKTIANGAERELEEELQVINNEGKSVASALKSASIIDHGLIYDNSNDVGRLHLGIPSMYLLHEDLEFDVKESELKMLGWYSAEQLLKPETNSESWTLILAQHFKDLSASQLDAYLNTVP